MMTFRQPFRGEYPVTQGFHQLIQGVTHNNEPHTGIDFGCPRGTEILASADGTVMAAGWDSTGYGYRVIIKHDADRSTLYAHLDKVSVNMLQHVKQGDVIGLSGYTGTVIPKGPGGAHLHFEARKVWSDYKSVFDPYLLPLMTVDDSIGEPAEEPAEPVDTGRQLLPSGKYRVACSAAYIRSWDTLQRDRILNKGERVFVYDDVKYSGDLPFRFIGAGRCIAEYDIDGTIILEADNGNKEED